MPKTGLVTGCAGFIGSHLCERLLAEGWIVRGLDDLSAGSMANMDSFTQNPKFTFFKVDITKPEQLDSAIFEKVDTIFHHAGKKMVFSVKFPREDLLTNAYGTLNMLLAAREKGVKRFLFASSITVYGNPKTPPSTEQSPIAPTTPYGASKFTCEEYCRLWHREYNLPIVLFRYASVYGPRQALNVGVVNVFIDKIRNDQPITVYGDGSSTRPFTYVDDVVQANILAANSKDPKIIGDVFNVGTVKSVSVSQLIEIISAKLEKKPKINYEKERIGEIKHMSADSSKIQKILGYKSAVPIEKGLCQTVEYYEKKRL